MNAPYMVKERDAEWKYRKRLFQENPRCWNTLDILKYSTSQNLEISRNSKLFFPAGNSTSDLNELKCVGYLNS